jgi:hypothetical protein
VIGGRNVSIVPGSSTFFVEVNRSNETVRAPVPAVNESVTLDGVELRRTETGLVARFQETRVQVAKPETYPGQRD